MIYYYIYAKAYQEQVDKVLAYTQRHNVVLVLIEINELKNLQLASKSHLIVTGKVHDIKQVLAYAKEYHVSVSIIPRPEQKELIHTFALPTTLKESIELALKPCDKKIDLLYANEELVLQEVVLGEVPPLDSFTSVLEHQSIWERSRSFFGMLRRLKALTHTTFKITTAKAKELKVSAVGAVGIEYHNRTFAAKLMSRQIKLNDGRLTLLLLAPHSMLHYMWYIFQTHILQQTPEKLPSSVGYIHTQKLSIATGKELTVTIDGDRCLQTPVTLETHQEAVALSVGEKFWAESINEKVEKESVKVDHLPCDKETINYLGQTIPLFRHASQEQFSGLFTNLREESRFGSTFIILLILATMIATFGLFINSASVIIGAMILAPLMQPIVGVSMGILRQDSGLLISGMKSIGLGITAVMMTSMVIALVMPLEQLTSEMNGRLSPTILDLFVAIVSGIAAAYAKSNEKIISSLAGVAIAVALVPPLAVSGIGLGWGEWSMFSSALLLFITNLVGIILAAALTFLVLGFSPVSVAKKGILYAIASVMVVSIPLSLSFMHMKEDIALQKKLTRFETTIGAKHIYLREIKTQKISGILEVQCQVIASGLLNAEEKKQLKERIVREVGNEVKLIVSFLYEL